MKNYLIIFAAVVSLHQSTHAQQSQLKLDSFSYSLGILFGNTLKQQGVNEISPVDLVEALEEIFANKPTKFSVEEASQIYSAAIARLSLKQYAAIKEEGEKFLAANKLRKGVVTTPSGLQYEVIKMGDGPKPTVNQTVRTHYHGTLINGKVFDSSVERGEPISFPLNGVIKGWTEALQLMPVGSKFRLFIPYDLAYGERGAGGDIKPFSTLIFEVELLGIE